MKKITCIILFSFFAFLCSNSFAQTFSNGTDFAIPDNNATGISSVINVSGLGTSLNCSAPLGLQSVCIKISHSYDADLDIFLVSPNGTTIELSTDNGGSGDHYGSNTANDLGPYTCFDMSAATAVTAGAAPFAGTYRPEGDFIFANNGQNPNGNWTLRVYDDAGGDIGTLLYWQLTFATSSISCATSGDFCTNSLLLTPGAACSPTAGSTSSGFTNSGMGCATGNADDDIWYSFVATATSHTVLVNGAANFDAVLAAYTSCGGSTPTGGGCVDATGTDGNETITITGLTIGLTYYIKVHDYAAGGGDFTICITSPGPPQCANYTGPADGAEICISTATLSWTAPSGGSPPTGYILYYGTDNPPTNIVNGVNLGNVLSYNVTGLTVGTTYFWRVIPTNAQGNAINCALQSFTRSQCINMSNGSTTTCNAGFFDQGGPSGSASDNSNLIYTVCPATAGQCIQATFYNFSTEANYDLLYIYNGNSTAAPQLPGSPFSGNLAPFSVVGSAANPTGCLTFRYISDGSVQSTGWDASLICAPCSSAPTYPPQDCGGAITVCSNQSFSGNSSGQGIVNDINSTNRGCLSTEHQSSWYYFSPATSGNIQLTIAPANGTDDYDFAIWGPMATIVCPPNTAPFRCSYSALGGNTGLLTGSGDNSEGVGGNKWVESMNVIAGQRYIMVIDNYSTSSQPFNLNWNLTAGATLNCTPLPIELITFTGIRKDKKNYLEWKTLSEINNDFFTIEKSKDGYTFTEYGTVKGAGFSTTTKTYSLFDYYPHNGITYYRLKQTDFNGEYTYSDVISIENTSNEIYVDNIHPNPTNGNINYTFYSTLAGNITIEFYDLLGKLILSEKQMVIEGNNTLSSKTEAFEKGIYSMKVTFEKTGFSAINKIIKN